MNNLWKVNVFYIDDCYTKGRTSDPLNGKLIAMPQGKLRGGGLRGEVQSTVRESYGGKVVSSNFKSRVVHPRNPKLVKGSPEDDEVNAQRNVFMSFVVV